MSTICQLVIWKNHLQSKERIGRPCYIIVQSDNQKKCNIQNNNWLGNIWVNIWIIYGKSMDLAGV